MNKTPPKQLVMAIFCGPNPLGTIEAIAETINEQDCSIVTSRMMGQSQHVSINLLISGSWSALLKLESSLQTVAKELKMSVIFHRIEAETFPPNQLLNYTIEVIAADKPGILHTISTFLTSQQINIVEIYSNTNHNQLGTALASLVLRVHIPTDVQISDIREQLMLICDAINVDAIFEPERL